MLKAAAGAVNGWPRLARMMDEAGRRLQAQHGEEPIPREAIQQEVCRLGGYRGSGVLPSDYSYNLVNQAAFSMLYPVFVRVEHGRYRYVGPAYPYTGPVFWKPKGGMERQVGRWEDGLCHLDFDPRASCPGEGARFSEVSTL